jgi:hypothetical protein
MLLVIAAILCLVTGGLASRKGYNFFLWAPAGGIIGLLILAFLPFTNDGRMPAEKASRSRMIGNVIGGVISAAAVVFVVTGLAGR